MIHFVVQCILGYWYIVVCHGHIFYSPFLTIVSNLRQCWKNIRFILLRLKSNLRFTFLVRLLKKYSGKQVNDLNSW